VGHRTGLDDAEKRTFLTLPGFELRILDRPARSQTIYHVHLNFKYVICIYACLCERNRVFENLSRFKRFI
jgi:hypothetical protein